MPNQSDIEEDVLKNLKTSIKTETEKKLIDKLKH